MADEFNKELCEERHQNLAIHIAEVKKSINDIFAKLNWFYLITIATLVGVIATYFK